VWVEDPNGAPWEVYTVLADAPAETGIAGDVSCCPLRGDDGEAMAVRAGSASSSSSCC
jgi:hypothetical protein